MSASREEINKFSKILSSINCLKENGINVKVDKEKLKEQFEVIKNKSVSTNEAFTKIFTKDGKRVRYTDDENILKDWYNLIVLGIKKLSFASIEENDNIARVSIKVKKDRFNNDIDKAMEFINKIFIKSKEIILKKYKNKAIENNEIDLSFRNKVVSDDDPEYFGFLYAIDCFVPYIDESTLLSEDSEESIPVTDDSVEQSDTNIEAVSESNNTSMLVVLNSLLRVYCSNFSVLHWNSVGEEFNDAHRNIAEEYEELCHKYIDPIAEMVTRLGSNPLNYVEVIELMNSSERKCLIVDSKRLYTRKDIIEIASKMFTDIVELLSATIESEELKAPINAGIRSELESILNDFDLQYRYINKRRLSIENQNIGTNDKIE